MNNSLLPVSSPGGRLFRLLTVVTAIPTATLLAQQSTTSRAEEDDKVVQLDPFTVQESNEAWKSQMTFSGSRVAENIMNVPVNISIITDDFMRDLGAVSLQDVLYYSASGVNPRVGYRDDISIRGFREVPLRDGMEGTSYANIPIYDLERVEVIKGPTALVFSNAANIGGTVNYVTKRPTAVSQGELNLVVGSDNRYGADITQRGPLNSKGTVRYRITGGAQEYDGFRQLEYSNNRLGSASVDWDVTDALVLKFDVFYADVKDRDFNRDLVDPNTGKLATFLPADFTTASPWNGRYAGQYRTRIEGVYTFNPNLVLRVLGATMENHYGYNVAQPFPGMRANRLTVGQRHLNFELDEERRDVQADVVWNFNLGPTAHRLTSGWAWNANDNWQQLYTGALADIVIADPVSSRPPASNPSTWTSLTPNPVSRSSGWTGYVQDAMTFFNDRAILSAGIRYVSASATSNGIDNVVPRYGAVFKINSQISAYYGYAEAYRPLSGFDVLGRPFVDIVGHNEELGVKLDLLDGRLFGSVAYFDMANDPVVTQIAVVNPATGQTVIGNVQTAKETNKGYEMDVGVSLDAGPGKWLIMATLYDADPRNAQGLRPARVVRYKGTLFTKYEFTEGPLKGFGFGGGISDSGAQSGTGIARQDPWTIYGAMASYRRQNWSLALNVDNIGDKTDAVIGSEAAFSVNTMRPRDIRLQAAYRW
jgi:iron complex outermembrane recepter protein